jgi:hypothetical protein
VATELVLILGHVRVLGRPTVTALHDLLLLLALLLLLLVRPTLLLLLARALLL